jgi:hypothetical protein
MAALCHPSACVSRVCPCVPLSHTYIDLPPVSLRILLRSSTHVIENPVTVHPVIPGAMAAPCHNRPHIGRGLKLDLNNKYPIYYDELSPLCQSSKHTGERWHKVRHMTYRHIMATQTDMEHADRHLTHIHIGDAHTDWWNAWSRAGHTYIDLPPVCLLIYPTRRICMICTVIWLAEMYYMTAGYNPYPAQLIRPTWCSLPWDGKTLIHTKHVLLVGEV